MPQTDNLLGMRDLGKRTSLSPSTIYRKIRRGEFPRQIEISTGRVAWSEAEINEWLATNIRNSRMQDR